MQRDDPRSRCGRKAEGSSSHPNAAARPARFSGRSWSALGTKRDCAGKSIVIKGELSCGEDLYIDGEVEGVIDPKGNRLTVGPNGRVKANVTARAVVVQGKLDGSIQASDRVDLKQSAIVTGDIATQRISIDDGAYFKGRVNIQKELPKKEVLRAAAS